MNEERCYKCEEVIEEYCYSPTVYYKDGECEGIEEMIVTMTEKELQEFQADLEEELKEEDENVDYVEFGVYCPHCLACM
jgi:hypothetical protein